MPFEKLVEDLQPERDRGRAPFFQVVFQLLNNPMPMMEFSDLRVTQMEVELGAPHFDLILTMTESKPVLAGTLEYNTGRFGPSTVASMLEDFEVLLEGIVEQPERALMEIPLDRRARATTGHQLESQLAAANYQFTFETD